MKSDGPSPSLNVLFICKGNIARSTMAEFLLKDMVKKYYPKEEFLIKSAAVTNEQIGKDIAPGTKLELDKNHIPYQKRKAVMLKKEDYEKYDYILGMDEEIVNMAIQICEGDSKNKIIRLLDFTNTPHNIIDPGIDNNFTRTYREIKEGCVHFLHYLEDKKLINKYKLTA